MSFGQGENPSVVLPVAVTLFAVHGLIAGAVSCAAVVGQGLLLFRIYRATGGKLDEAATLVEAGTLKSTAATRLAPINAANLKKAHALLEDGHVVGKIVLEGF